MALSLNKVMLIGNLTRDPDLRQSENGNYFLRFSVATNREWTIATGEKKNKAEFHQVIVFGEFANVIFPKLHRGDQVFVEGIIDTNAYTNAQGEAKTKMEIISQNLIVLNCKQKNDNGGDFTD